MSDDGSESSRDTQSTESASGASARPDGFEDAEGLLRRIQSVAEIGCWEYDVATDTVRATDQLYEILEMPTDMSFNLETGLDFFVPSMREEVRTAVHTCIEDGTPFDQEAPIVTMEGSRKWVRVKGQLHDKGTPGARLTGTVQDISARKHVEERRQEEEAVLRRMHEITSDQDKRIEEKIDELLDLGRDHMSLPYGFLTRIEDDVQRIVRSTGTHPLLQPGASCPLSRSYCRKTLQEGGLLSVQNAPSEGWADDPAFETFGLGSYIGAKVIVDGEMYGTFCFAAHEARDTPFSDREKTFLEILSRWVSYELERERIARRQARQNQRLQHQNERLDRLAVVVSHDLRNPVNVAKGRLQLFREETGRAPEPGEAPTSEQPAGEDPEDSALADEHLNAVDRALDRIDTIIEDMLALARHGEAVKETERLRLAEVAEATWEQVQTDGATLRFGADLGPEVTVDASEGRLRQLLENLFRNAVEHGEGTVTVEVGALPNGFYVADDGPGLPDDNRDKVFEAGYSTDENGTGLGLSIVRAVAGAHGWEISATNGERGGARFEITHPASKEDTF